MRTFIALPLPQTMSDALGDVAAQLSYQDKSHAVRWVDQNNYHITLAFLGDLSESDLEQLADELDSHLDHMSFEITLSHLSPFPESRPRLVAAMVEKNDSLIRIQKQVMSAVQACKTDCDRKKFNPHITLGRLKHKKAAYVTTTTKILEVQGVIDEVSIFESQLKPSGASYEAMVRYPLDNYEDLYDELLME